MDAQEIINYIATSEKKTPIKLFVKEREGASVSYGSSRVYGEGTSKVVFGDWSELKSVVEQNADAFEYFDIENDRRNSGVPLLNMKDVNARIEPGALIRERVEIGNNAVIMMGAVINIGAVIGEGTMIDMGAVLGGRATVGKNCHIGAVLFLLVLLSLHLLRQLLLRITSLLAQMPWLSRAFVLERALLSQQVL